MIILPANQIIRELQGFGFQVVPPKHANYLCPEEEWIPPFCAGLWGRLGPWRNDHTCVDFTAEVDAFAEEAFRRGDHPKDINLGPAFGWGDLIVMSGEKLNEVPGDGDTKHETCICRTKIRWLFIEGQNGLWCPLGEAIDSGLVAECLACRV